MPDDIRINMNNDDITVDDNISIRENAVIQKRPLENVKRNDYRPVSQSNDNVPIDGLDLLMNPKKRNQSDTESIGSINSQERRRFGPERPSSSHMVQSSKTIHVSKPSDSYNEHAVFKKPIKHSHSKHHSNESSSYHSDNNSRKSTPVKKFIGPERRSNENIKDDETSVSGSSYSSHSGSSYSSRSGSVSGSSYTSRSGSSSVSGSQYSIEPKKMSYEEMLKAKQQIIYDLEKLDNQGYHPSKRYSMTSDYEEMKSERDRLKKQRDIEKSIRFQRRLLSAFVSGIEFLNGKFDPFNVKLDGWSESMMETITDYDEVFEDLYEKYNEKVKMAPEIKLIMMVGSSALMFHLTNTYASTSNLSEIFQQNPHLMKGIQEAAMNKMAQNPMAQQDPTFQMMHQTMRGMNSSQPSFDSMTRNTSNPMPSNTNANDEMMGPSGVDEILAQLDRNTQITPPLRNNSPPNMTQMNMKRNVIKKKKSGGIAIDL